MPTTIPATQLGERIQKLVEQREQHTEAIGHIDAMLAGVGAALTGKPAPASKGKPPIPASSAKASTGRKRRKTHKYATSAEESLLDFVKLHKDPTTKELKAHYFSEGRGGTVDNVLSKLVRDKKLKREPLEGQRGSRYLLI